MEITCTNIDCQGPILAADRFCGNCGTPAPDVRRAPQPATAHVTVEPLSQEPLFSHEPPRRPGPLSNATRYLCAAAYLNDNFANQVIWQLLATRRAVAPSINFDVGPVLRHWKTPYSHASREAVEQCGLLIDDYLHKQWVQQGFRADINPDDYVPVRISYPDKGFDETCWLRLFGYPGQQVSSLLG
jgi:hypothetical protein